MPKDKRVKYRMSAQVGDRYPIGGEVWTKQDEDNFRWWYSRMSKYKGLNPDPDDIEQYYDYRGFWREDPKRAESMLRMDATQHFIDKWKYPGHPTFSSESIYSNDRMPGGSWVKHEGKFYYKPSSYTSGYLDRTREYLRGTNEGIAIEGENGTEYILIPKMPEGGYVASRDNTSVGAPGIDANARVGNRIYQPINIAETIAGFVPGVGDVLDARDFMRAAANRDRVGMALAAAAFIPLAGDALQEYFKLRRRRKFLEEVPLKEGNKKGWDGSEIKESDEELLEDMPEYAHPESPMDEALIAHNSRITSGAYERVTGKSIAGFGNKIRNIKQKYPGIYEKMFDVDNIDIDSKEAEDFLEMFFEEKPGTYKGLSKEGKRELLRKAYIRIYQESPMFKIGVDGDNAIAYSKYSFNNFFGDNPDGLNAGLSHELDHAVWSNADAENMAQMVRESDEWFDADKITGNDREYLQNPLELSARGSQIKDYFGLADDTQEVTPSMLKYAAKHYGETWIDNNMKSFFEGITDWDKAAKWLSKYATVTVPAALIPRLVESGEEDLKDMEDFNRRHGGPANTSVSKDGYVRYLGYRPFFNPMRLYQRRKYIIDKLVADYGFPVVDAEREVDGIMNKSFLDDGYYDVKNKSYGIGGWKGEDFKEFILTYKDGGLADQIDFLAKKIRRMPDGGYIASRDNTNIGGQGINANVDYGKRIFHGPDLTEIVAGFIPGVSDVMDAKDLYDSIKEGDALGAGLAAVGFIPIIGGLATNANRVRRASKIIADGIEKMDDGSWDISLDKLSKAFYQMDFIDRYNDELKKVNGIIKDIPESVKNTVDKISEDKGSFYHYIYKFNSAPDALPKSTRNDIELLLNEDKDLNQSRKYLDFREDKRNIENILKDDNFYKYRIEEPSYTGGEITEVGSYNALTDEVILDEKEFDTLVHELRHRADMGRGFPLSEDSYNLLNSAYRTTDNIASDMTEKIATNTELRALIFQNFLIKNERLPKSHEELDSYINSLSNKDIGNMLSNLSYYGRKYAEDIYNSGNEARDRIGIVRKALKIVPALGAGVIFDEMMKSNSNNLRNDMQNANERMDDGGLVERQDELYDTLTEDYEMPSIQAIAVIANLTHESGLDPYAEGDSGASLGLQQWRDDRRKALEKFALSRRHSYPTYDDQIAFLMNEYNNGQAFQFTHRGKNLYAAGKTKNPTFDYYQFSKNDFENANSLYDAVIAWNQGVGRPTKKYAYNDRRYAIAKSIADRHGIPYGNESFYNEMGFNDDAVIFDDDLVEKEEDVDQPTGSDAPAPSGEELFMEQYGNEVVAQMLAMENNARNLYNNTASMIRQHKQSLEEDKKREEESVKEVDERQREREFLAAVLPNLQLNIKGVSQIGKDNG